MQRSRSSECDVISRAFGQRLKAARTKEGLTQSRLQERLADRGVKLDTSAITRIESGEREPRLSEALAISQVLGFGLADLTTSAPDSDDSVVDVRKLIRDSRESLTRLLRALDQAAGSLRPVDTGSDRAGGP